MSSQRLSLPEKAEGRYQSTNDAGFAGTLVLRDTHQEWRSASERSTMGSKTSHHLLRADRPRVKARCRLLLSGRQAGVKCTPAPLRSQTGYMSAGVCVWLWEERVASPVIQRITGFAAFGC